MLVQTIDEKFELYRHNQKSKQHCFSSKTFQNKSLKHRNWKIPGDCQDNQSFSKLGSFKIQEFLGGPKISRSFQWDGNTVFAKTKAVVVIVVLTLETLLLLVSMQN